MKHSEQLTSRAITLIAIDVDNDTKLKILELYGDRLENREFEMILEGLNEEQIKQSKATIREQKTAKREQVDVLREKIFVYGGTNARYICENA